MGRMGLAVIQPSYGRHLDWPPERKQIREWVLAPLSEFNQRFRLTCLGRAFGLRVDYLERYIYADASMGGGLAAEILAWCARNEDVSHNNPPQEETTFFAKLNLG